MLTIQQRINRAQAKRQVQLANMRQAASDKIAAQRIILEARIERQHFLEQQRILRQAVREQALRERLIKRSGDIALTLDDVVALRPCSRIQAVHKMLRPLWEQDIPVTAQQALEAGCNASDITWVMMRLKRIKVSGSELFEPPDT